MLNSWTISGTIILLLAFALYLLFFRSDYNRQRFPVILLVLAISTYLILAFSFHWFIVDDVYISLRYARNLAEGYGLVFNTDKSNVVEGYSNFLWVIMESVLFLFRMKTDEILKVISAVGVLFGAACIVLIYKITHLLTANKRTAIIAALFLCAVPEFAFWAIGGLETSMYIFWLLAGIYRYLIEKRNTRLHIGSMICLVMASLTRPEGLFFALVFILWEVINGLVFNRNIESSRRLRIRQTISAVATFGLLYSIYFLWRYDYYGHFFPNTFYAKKISNPEEVLHRIRQSSVFFVRMFPFFALACIGYAQIRSTPAREKIMVMLLMFVLMGFSFAARNEWMPGHRYELPFVPLLMVFFAAGINHILSYRLTPGDSGLPKPLLRFSVLFFLILFQAHPFIELGKKGNKLSRQLNRAHVPFGKWLKEHANPGASYASWDMGAIPYYSELPHIIDINSEGLLNVQTTQGGYDVGKLLSGNPSFLVLPPNTSYTRPREILDFYTHPKLLSDYEFLFCISFIEEYVLNVYIHKDVRLHDLARKEGLRIADESRQMLD